MNHDVINAAILLVASALQWHNVSLLYRHKSVKGVSLQATAFYAAWGMWNCYYFSSLGQWLSVASNVSIMSANLVWLSLAWSYRVRPTCPSCKGYGYVQQTGLRLPGWAWGLAPCPEGCCINRR